MRQSSSSKYLLVLASLAALLPVVLTYAALAFYARNLPMFDDYLALLRFAVSFHDAPSIPARLTLVIAAQHSEYKLIFEHAIVAIELTLIGRLNLLFLVWLGNFSLLGLLPVFWKALFPDAADRLTRVLLMVPVCWLLFELNYVESMDWAMGGLQSITVILFAVWSLFLLTRSGLRSFALACLAALLAICCSANGLLLAPIGLLLLARGRHIGRVFLWLGSLALGTAIYLFRYVPLRYPAQRFTALDRVMMFVSFLGGAVENRQHRPLPYASVVLGLLLLAAAVYAVRRHVYRQNPFAAALWLWILLSAVPVVAFRADAALTAQLTGRYKIYSDLLLILTLAFACRHITTLRDLRAHKGPFSACVAFCILFGLFSDFAGLRFLAKRLHETGAAARQHDIPADWNAALTQAQERGIYTLPSSTE